MKMQEIAKFMDFKQMNESLIYCFKLHISDYNLRSVGSHTF